LPAAFFDADRATDCLVADLPLTHTLPMTPALMAAGWHVVPISQMWAATRAVVNTLPTERLLLSLAPRARLPRPGGLVLLLDGERQGVVGSGPAGPFGAGHPARSRFDNRYVYPRDRFPPPRLLHDRGVRAVRWISRSGIAEDLNDYAGRLLEGEIQIFRFDASA
jgi:hypothetical protein